MAKRRSSRKRRASTRKSAPQAIMSNSHGGVCCGCCSSRGLGWLFIILGILYIGYDLGAFQWWTISWWSILFILCGWVMLKKQ